MGRTPSPTQQSKSTRPFLTTEGNDNYLISLANSLVERRLIEGTASSQEVTHFLKLGSAKERLERERLEEENKLLRAKTEALQAQKRDEELYEEVLIAMKRYSGYGVNDDEY